MQDNRIALGNAWRKFMKELSSAEYSYDLDRLYKSNAEDFEDCIVELRNAIIDVLGLQAPGFPEVLSTVEFDTIPVFSRHELEEY